MTVDQIVVYESDNDFRLEVKTDGETVWLSVDQMAKLFGRDRSVISRHVDSVFSEGELLQEGYMQILHKTSSKGGRPVAYYNLDVLISVGYRVKSVQGTRFRQRATRVLREMLLNRVAELKRIDSLERQMETVKEDVEQIREGVDYLAQKLESDADIPHQRMGLARSGARWSTALRACAAVLNVKDLRMFHETRPRHAAAAGYGADRRAACFHFAGER